MLDVKKTLKDAEAKMQSTAEHLADTFDHIRAGRATVKLLDGIKADYYGSPMDLTQVALTSQPIQARLCVA